MPMPEMDPRFAAVQAMQAAVLTHGANLQPYRALGNIAAKVKGDLIIFNYTPLAAYERQWTWIEQVCRGLILRISTQAIVALPFFKFFNVNEREETLLERLPEVPDVVTRKVDGALGISYPAADGLPAIATRGAFTSPEAEWATDYLRTHYPLFCQQEDGQTTYLFEICAPLAVQPHITPEQEGLVLLGMRSLEANFGHDGTYEEVRATATRWGFPVVPHYPYTTSEIVARCATEEHEGYVARYGDMRVKFKTTRYVTINRIITSMNPRRLRDYLQEGGDMEPLLRPLPPWYATMLKNAADGMRNEIASQEQYLLARYEALRSIESGKEFAEMVQGEPVAIRPALFALRNGNRPYLPILWKWLDLTPYEIGFGVAGAEPSES
jgi:RNA ligase